MTIFPRIKKGFNKLGKMERIRSGTARVVAVVLLAAGFNMVGIENSQASVPPTTLASSPGIAGAIILAPGGPLGLVDGSQQMAGHSSHVSHASHVSHGSHCSGYSFC